VRGLSYISIDGAADTHAPIPDGPAPQAAAEIAIRAERAGGAPDKDVLERSLTETLRAAVERHGERLVLLCSFQKEESVLLDELLRIGADNTPVRIVTIDTGVLFRETLETWRVFEQRFGVNIEVQDASGTWTGPEQCCSVAKVAALQRALDGAEGWITGIRREQGSTRANAELTEMDAKRGLWKYNPLALWSEKDLWRRIHERGLPYNSLHDQGYSSIGCATCTLPGEGREGRWAGTDKTECGLHLDFDGGADDATNLDGRPDQEPATISRGGFTL
jgi:phosphoadenosine phosphosulfate reductase